MRSRTGSPTKYPGVKQVGPKRYEVRAKARDPRTGKKRDVVETVSEVTAAQAAARRLELLEEIKAGGRKEPQLVRVGEYGQLWAPSKAIKLSRKTAETYASALDLHVLEELGDFYYSQLTRQDVQDWVDRSLLEQWTTPTGKRKMYSPVTVHGWFRVFRTMTRDAVEDLGMERDPTSRIQFPEFDDHRVSVALSSERLACFLCAMRELFPQHYALTVALAYTGLRFCHVCAFRWDDWDEQDGLVRVSRKHVAGEIGPVSRKKPAPAEVPVEEELAHVLRWHRRSLVSNEAPGLAEGWMFPASNGALRTPSGLQHAWKRCLQETGIEERFTVHGLRYTFTDLVRRAKVDAVVRRALTGHVTPQMQRHYSSVSIDEKRDAVATVHSLVPLNSDGM